MISLLAPEDHQPGHPRLGSAGRISFGWEVRIVGQDGRDLPVGSAGELLIRGEPLFSGYWRDPEATAAAFAEGGWYRTGDIARLTGDGYLYILDRAKDMIISGGENIYPAEVEAVLARHPAVADVAVLGRPDPVWGEAVHAVIIPASEGASAGEIIAWRRGELAHFKCPKSVEFTDALPRTTTGKVLKRELRARLAGQVRVGTAVANAALRPPVLAALTAAQLDQAAGGRFILGLGVGNAVMNARFGVAPAAPPLRLVEEYVEVIRSVLTLAPGYDGQVFRTGMIPLDSRPVRADLPVYLGALGPRMLALAGRVADGVILNLMTPAQAGQAAGLVRGAARAAGRDPASVEVACVVHCCLSGDPGAAAAAARAVVPRYVLHPAAPRLFGELDGGVELGGVRELVLAGDRAGAAGLVPQQVADGFVAHGSEAACAARLAEYRAAGVDLPVVFPMPVGGDWGYERTIAAMARRG